MRSDRLHLPRPVAHLGFLVPEVAKRRQDVVRPEGGVLARGETLDADVARGLAHGHQTGVGRISDHALDLAVGPVGEKSDVSLPPQCFEAGCAKRAMTGALRCGEHYRAYLDREQRDDR